MKAVLKTPSTLYYCINFVDLYGHDVRPLKSDGGLKLHVTYKPGIST